MYQSILFLRHLLLHRCLCCCRRRCRLQHALAYIIIINISRRYTAYPPTESCVSLFCCCCSFFFCYSPFLLRITLDAADCVYIEKLPINLDADKMHQKRARAHTYTYNKSSLECLNQIATRWQWQPTNLCVIFYSIGEMDPTGVIIWNQFDLVGTLAIFSWYFLFFLHFCSSIIWRKFVPMKCEMFFLPIWIIASIVKLNRTQMCLVLCDVHIGIVHHHHHHHNFKWRVDKLWRKMHRCCCCFSCSCLSRSMEKRKQYSESKIGVVI